METIEQEKKYQMSLSEKEVDLIGDILHWHADYNDYNTSRDDMTFYMQEKQKCDTLIEHIRNLREAITAWKSSREDLGPSHPPHFKESKNHQNFPKIFCSLARHP